MNTYSFYKNASRKSCSEDFASEFRCEHSGKKYLILTDGCSTSKGDVIMGSRIFHRYIKKHWDILSELDDLQSGIENFCYFDPYVESDDLLFTFFIIEVDEQNDSVKIFQLGDGQLFLQRKSGEIERVTWEYRDNMPFYIGYSARKDFDKSFIEKFEKIQKVYNTNSLALDSFGSDMGNLGTKITLKLSDYKKVFCFSDGIEQISDIKDEELVLKLFEENGSHSNIFRRKFNFLTRRSVLGDDVSFIGLDTD
jgi:hypothetical protein